tara:strand:- start:112 stop:291 length:180 start_codon:yes stop_codon:yes gene_type:complete
VILPADTLRGFANFPHPPKRHPTDFLGDVVDKADNKKPLGTEKKIEKEREREKRQGARE